MSQTRCLRPKLIAAVAGALMIWSGGHSIVHAQVSLSSLTDLQMAPFDSNFQHIRIPSTGQLLSRIGPSVWQGNADIYPIDPRITSPGDVRRAGHYWSQFLMAGTDPSTNQYFLTDMVESEGETLQSFNVIQSSGKVIEYEGTWAFRNLFTTTAHHWVWVEGNDHYHRVRVSLDVLNPISSVKSIWTELFNQTDAYATVTASTRDNGIQTLSTLGTTNQHYFGQYTLGRDDWLAFTNPQDGQAGSIARALLSSNSDIRADDEVTPIWADFSLFDNIELHIHRQPSGANLAPGTSFFMDNLLITNPTLDNTNWVESKIIRGKEWIGLIGPAIDPPTVDLGSPVTRFFVPPGSAGNWSVTTNWTPTPIPDANDTAIINSGRTATINSNVGAVGTLRLGDAGAGTLNIQPGAALEIENQALVGAGGGSNSGIINQTGGTLTIIGSDPVIFLAFDTDDTASYTMSSGALSTGNLWFRFGNGTMTQTGGTVDANQLVLGEGGAPFSQATYSLQNGSLNIAGPANVGKAPGSGDPFANSNGKMNISGGIATFGDLLFGSSSNDAIELSGAGVLRVRQANYSLSEALADINSAHIKGVNLLVGTVDLAGTLYTQISKLVGDYNGNGVVDAADYVVWRDTLSSSIDLRADGNGNHVIDQNDYGRWRANFGASAQSAFATAAQVPEPISLLPTLFDGLCLVFFRWRRRGARITGLEL